MKILSNKEFKKELAEILTYDIFTVECLDLDCDSNDIVLDIQDINIITKDKYLLVMSSFEQYCLNSAKEAMKSTIIDFEENNLSLTEADGILVYFQMNSNYDTDDLIEAMQIIYDSSTKYTYITGDPDVLFGVVCDNSLKNDYAKVTVFISYSKQRRGCSANNKGV